MEISANFSFELQTLKVMTEKSDHRLALKPAEKLGFVMEILKSIK